MPMFCSCMSSAGTAIGVPFSSYRKYIKMLRCELMQAWRKVFISGSVVSLVCASASMNVFGGSSTSDPSPEQPRSLSLKPSSVYISE